MSNGNNHPMLIFKAELIDKKVSVTFQSSHVPTLSYVSKVLDQHIMELITIEKIKVEAVNKPQVDIIHKPSIIDKFRKR